MIQRRQLAALLALTLMWGLNWPVMKLALREMTPLYFRALTMSCGALWLLAYYRARGVVMWPRGAQWRSVVVLGLPNMLGWHTASILGVNQLASGRAAILGFTMPIWTVLIGVLFLDEKLTRRIAIAALAVAVTIALLGSVEFNAISGHPVGIVWMEIAAILWASGTIMMRRAHLSLPLETLTVWMMLLSSACLWLLAWTSEPWPRWQYSGAVWLSLVYSVAINYGFAQIIWSNLSRHLPPATSAMSIMAVPVVGTLTATLVVGEWPHWQDYVALVFVAGAIAAVLLPARTLRTQP